MDELASLQPQLQMNIRSLSGGIFDARAKWCHKQVAEGRIHYLGSDMHNIDTRPPYHRKGLEWVEKKILPIKAEQMIWQRAKERFRLE